MPPETRTLGSILMSHPHHSGHPTKSCGAYPLWRLALTLALALTLTLNLALILALALPLT